MRMVGKFPMITTELLPETTILSTVLYAVPNCNIRDTYVISGIIFWMGWIIIQLQYRELQITIGQPSNTEFMKFIKKSSLPNCPVSPMDIQAAIQIFGPDIGVLKGKTTHQHPPILESPISKVLAFILQ